MNNHPNRTAKASKKKIIAAENIAHDHDHDYSALLIGVRASFQAAYEHGSAFFTTDAVGLNTLYLAYLPEAERQIHNCHCCRRFIDTYGGLVTINEAGEITPVMWNPAEVPGIYAASFASMFNHVKKARVTGVFLSKETIWGNPVTGAWSHMAVMPPAQLIYQDRALTPSQAMAAKKENFRTVASALADLTAPMLDQALRLLRADTLARSERFTGPAQWLRDLHDRPKGRKGDNVLWRAIAAAPEGFCHPKASVIGPLLEDIAAGMEFDDIKRRFDAKMHPLAYQRPQAAPAAATIKQAEALVEKLGITRSLDRRFARVDEMETIWRPVVPKNEPVSGSVFGHLKPKETGQIAPIMLPTQKMTWEKFARTVLPTAESISVHVPSRGNFEARLTALYPDAPNILKWGNTVSGYVYHGGSEAFPWGLTAGSWAAVTAISPAPNLWGEAMPHLGEGVLLVLEGCIDSRVNQGNALFPEILKSELHGVRSVIEAYSKTAEIIRQDGPYACGLRIDKNSAQCSLRVFSSGAWTSYTIDRMD